MLNSKTYGAQAKYYLGFIAYERNAEKIAEKVLVSIKPLKGQGLLKKPFETGSIYWNTIYTEPTAPPPKKL